MIRSLLALSFLSAAAAPPPADDPLIEQVAGGVCHIEISHDPESDQTTTGSGFLISGDGLIITNWHIVAGGVSGWLQFQGDGRNTRFPFDVVAIDKGSDLALLQSKNVAEVQRLRLWVFGLRAEKLPAGQRGYALGYPAEGFAARRGSVNAVRKYGDIAPGSHAYPAESIWLHHFIPIEPGITGGPLIDDDGRVAGVVTWSSSDGKAKFATPVSKIHAFLNAARADSGIAWSEIALPSKAILADDVTWEVPEIKVSKASGASVLSAIRALRSVAHCPICGGDGDLMKQSTTASDNQLSPGKIRRSETTCTRCDGDGYNENWSKISRVLDNLTLKLAGLNEEDRRFQQASDQFLEKIGVLAWRSPGAWRTLVNADFANRLRRTKAGKPIFGVGLIGEAIELAGIGPASIVRPLLESAAADPYIFVMIDPRLDNREGDALQAAFWGGVVADTQPLDDETTVIFIRSGFVMIPSTREE
jgi:S1-C subfamily serine protease